MVLLHSKNTLEKKVGIGGVAVTVRRVASDALQVRKTMSAGSEAAVTTRLREISPRDIRHWRERFLRSRDLALNNSLIAPPLLDLFTRELDGDGYGAVQNSTGTRHIPRALQAPRVKLGKYNGLIEFFDSPSCEPILPDVLLYNRIFKTGSTTMSHVMSFLGFMMDFTVKIGRRTENEANPSSGLYPPDPVKILKALGTNLSTWPTGDEYLRGEGRGRSVYSVVL